MDMSLTEVIECEVCGAINMRSLLNLGDHPMCDDLVPLGDPRICKEFPIEILFCDVCKTANQRFQVPKETLFPKTYHYRSRLTGDVLSGMSDFVEKTEKMFGNLAGKLVLDVGCNDGSLLSLFTQRGAKTIGVEPTNAADDALSVGHKIYKDYFDENFVKKFKLNHGFPDIITFTNVFAHIERFDLLLKALKELMGDRTLLIVENHYLGSVLKQNQFDTFYHEHPRTYSVTSFLHIAETLGISVTGLNFPERYGGNIRVFMGNGTYFNETQDKIMQEALLPEENFSEDFLKLNQNISLWQSKKRKQIYDLHQKYGLLYAKAFPGRAAILVKLLEIDETVFGGVFEKPDSPKIGNFVPGTRIPILSDNKMMELMKPGQPLINFAWHIPNEIYRYLDELGFRENVINIVDSEDFQN